MRPRSPLLVDLCLCLGFFTRLPLPSTASRSEPQSLATFPRAVRMVPVVGGLVGALAAIVMVAASLFGFPPPLAAPLAICALALVSGAMHEDGLADCADSFLGGATRERKLKIMRDSRIGTFGAVALVLSLYLRAASLALIADESLGPAAHRDRHRATHRAPQNQAIRVRDFWHLQARIARKLLTQSLPRNSPNHSESGRRKLPLR